MRGRGLGVVGGVVAETDAVHRHRRRHAHRVELDRAARIHRRACVDVVVHVRAELRVVRARVVRLVRRVVAHRGVGRRWRVRVAVRIAHGERVLVHTLRQHRVRTNPTKRPNGSPPAHQVARRRRLQRVRKLARGARVVRLAVAHEHRAALVEGCRVHVHARRRIRVLCCRGVDKMMPVRHKRARVWGEVRPLCGESVLLVLIHLVHMRRIRRLLAGQFCVLGRRGAVVGDVEPAKELGEVVRGAGETKTKKVSVSDRAPSTIEIIIIMKSQPPCACVDQD
ncbi:hypothetical protein PHLGIDRAFT_348576 [Phlebiopsis gigantea 11061_1 CR5-6]|uniref:Uncharacterized protein n=1 Tax=Phlebiopsis gigantea (strain 11061_1 CR5-6) TaxID=745531 RepID=A0A0C3RPQ5_PHLG1|nr:hypothetical protein PHLGIDRAFT_348576 [Phlebiopsis gigantea 11061_1 CR5-6]